MSQQFAKLPKAVNLTQVGSTTFDLGQQLAGASLPIVLTASQISTLTPLSTVDVGNFPTSIDVGNFPTEYPLPTAQVTTLTPPTTVTVQQATGSNLHTVIDSGSITATISGVATASNQTNGTQKTTVVDLYGNIAKIAPIGTIGQYELYRLVGTNFGSAIDTTFWTASNSGTASASGVALSKATLTSGTDAGGYGHIKTVRSGRFIFAHPMKYRSIVRIPALTKAGTTRRWGAYTTTGTPPTTVDGYYFELDENDVLSVNTRNNAGTVDSVASGSFNGTVSSYAMNTDKHAYEIVYFLENAQFFIDNVLVHTFTPTTSPMSATCTLPVSATVVNTGTTSASLEMWAGMILRMGRSESAPRVVYVAGAGTAQILKNGPGTVRHIIVSNGTGIGTMLLYDALSATNQIMGITIPANQGPSGLTCDLDYYTGLTYTITGTNMQTTFVFE